MEYPKVKKNEREDLLVFPSDGIYFSNFTVILSGYDEFSIRNGAMYIKLLDCNNYQIDLSGESLISGENVGYFNMQFLVSTKESVNICNGVFSNVGELSTPNLWFEGELKFISPLDFSITGYTTSPGIIGYSICIISPPSMD